MTKPEALGRIRDLAPYAPGLSIDEIASRHGLARVIKLASNENPLGASPLAQDAIRRHAAQAFRYPQGGNPRLAAAIAALHDVEPQNILIGNGSDEIIDLLCRIMAREGEHNIVCFRPYFSLYPIQARICGLETRRAPLNEDLSFNMQALLDLVDESTRLVFLTTPDNPSGYCPDAASVASLAQAVARRAPAALLVVDEAYMDFTGPEMSLLASGNIPANAVFMRTFSKSFGLAGLRLGYAVAPAAIADAFWRARLPFSVNIMAEAAALAALEDEAFRQATMATVRKGRELLARELELMGCRVWPSHANFLLFQPPANAPKARQCFDELLAMGIIIRTLDGYGMPDRLRVSIGNHEENMLFLNAMRKVLQSGQQMP